MAAMTKTQPKTVQILPPAKPKRQPGLGVQLLTAGSAACIADIMTFPLDTVKVRLQVSHYNFFTELPHSFDPLTKLFHSIAQQIFRVISK